MDDSDFRKRASIVRASRPRGSGTTHPERPRYTAPMYAFFSRPLILVGNFLVQYHYYVIAFLLSPFLAAFVGVEYVGYAFIASSILATLLLYAAPPIFRSFGTTNVIGTVGVLEALILVALTQVAHPYMAVILVTAQSTLAYMLFIGMDLVIESSTATERVTGQTRTAYLTITNLAVLAATLSLSVLVVQDAYGPAFITSVVVLLLFVIHARFFFPAVSYVSSPEADGSVIARLSTDQSVRNISAAHLVLQTFFSWMAIYIPVLLFMYQGFSWAEIGIILSIAMLPYILFEYPFGYIADRYIGEQELLILGFIIMSASLIAIPFLPQQDFWLWTAVMFIARIGAAMVEAMTEVHFFRRVSHSDTSIITFFRALKPIGSIIGPLIAGVCLIFLDLTTTFAVLGVATCVGIIFSRRIIDSK